MRLRCAHHASAQGGSGRPLGLRSSPCDARHVSARRVACSRSRRRAVARLWFAPGPVACGLRPAAAGDNGVLLSGASTTYLRAAARRMPADGWLRGTRKMLSLCVGAIPQLAPEGGAILRSAGVLPLRPVALIDPLGMNGKTPRGGRGGCSREQRPTLLPCREAGSLNEMR